MIKLLSKFVFKCVIGIPTEEELKKLSEGIVSAVRSKKTTTFTRGINASTIRSRLGISLGVPMTKIMSCQTLGWPEVGDSIEVHRFCKLFEIWKTLKSDPMRIILVAALLDTSIKSMIPEPLVTSFADGMKN